MKGVGTAKAITPPNRSNLAVLLPNIDSLSRASNEEDAHVLIIDRVASHPNALRRTQPSLFNLRLRLRSDRITIQRRRRHTLTPQVFFASGCVFLPLGTGSSNRPGPSPLTQLVSLFLLKPMHLLFVYPPLVIVTSFSTFNLLSLFQIIVNLVNLVRSNKRKKRYELIKRF